MAVCLHVLLRFERWPHDLMYLIRVGYLPPVWHRLWGSFNNYVNIPAEATSPEIDGAQAGVSFTNYVNNMRWLGVLKFQFLSHLYGEKCPGRWSKKNKIMIT